MSEPANTRQLVWDLPLRLCHWGLVIAVAGSFVTHEIGTTAFRWHVWFGYATLILVAFRLVWGFVGPAHARFGSFLRGPRAAWTYARGLFSRAQPAAPVAGHNPLGGWMVLALLAILLVQAAAGLFANDEIINAGPLYGYVDSEQSDVLSRLHRQLSDWILIAVGVHVAAAFFYLLVKRENLIGAMVTGYRRGLPAAAAIGGHRVALAAAIVAVLGAGLWWLVRTAPEYSLILF
ncbi:MAG: cytochrome b/b6 domain-containing protein [Steroidobacteraceae bacterium]|nr:cytochrome b/b6 domain-containing protein [Steroidobacteraceae bacterium]